MQTRSPFANEMNALCKRVFSKHLRGVHPLSLAANPVVEVPRCEAMQRHDGQNQCLRVM